MARLARLVVPGLPHHGTQRGNRRDPSIFEYGDQRIYCDMRAEQLGKSEVEVWADCPLPKHVHFTSRGRRNMQTEHLMSEFEDGRTDLLGPLLEAGIPASFQNPHGVSLMQTCGYYGDVSAIRTLLARGASLQELGPNLGLSAACFHGHWRLCLLLLELGANVNDQSEESKETPLHASLCSTDRILLDRVVEVLISRGANPNLPSADGVGTGGFMRDARTKGETALHRAAAFGEEGTVKMLLNAGARREARDANGDTPLSWASWYLRPASILHQLCFGEHRVNPDRKSMRANLIGFPRTTP